MVRNKIERTSVTVRSKLDALKAKACECLMGKCEGASHFVEILVAIIIVIAVGAIFKNQIINFITTITGQATQNASNLF